MSDVLNQSVTHTHTHTSPPPHTLTPPPPTPLTPHTHTAHNTGDPLDLQTRRQFHLILWEQAGRAYEAEEYSDALPWYNYSLSLFPAQEGMDKNVAKLQVSAAHMYNSCRNDSTLAV